MCRPVRHLARLGNVATRVYPSQKKDALPHVMGKLLWVPLCSHTYHKTKRVSDFPSPHTQKKLEDVSVSHYLVLLYSLDVNLPIIYCFECTKFAYIYISYDDLQCHQKKIKTKS